MGTTADKLNKIITTKEAIRTAINNKGGTLTKDDTFASYATAIENIKTGGDESSIKQNNINRVKLNDLQYAITYGIDMPSDELYETCEDKCQALYSVITGGLK